MRLLRGHGIFPIKMPIVQRTNNEISRYHALHTYLHNIKFIVLAIYRAPQKSIAIYPAMKIDLIGLVED